MNLFNNFEIYEEETLFIPEKQKSIICSKLKEFTLDVNAKEKYLACFRFGEDPVLHVIYQGESGDSLHFSTGNVPESMVKDYKELAMNFIAYKKQDRLFSLPSAKNRELLMTLYLN